MELNGIMVLRSEVPDNRAVNSSEPIAKAGAEQEGRDALGWDHRAFSKGVGLRNEEQRQSANKAARPVGGLCGRAIWGKTRKKVDF